MSINIIVILITVVISFVSFSRRNLFDALSLLPYNIYHKKEWYRIVSHGFIHASVSHLLINMFVLWSFGSNVEHVLAQISPNGAFAYVMFYVGALIFSSIYDIVQQRDNAHYSSIGASGAVMAAVFFSIYFSPWSKIYFFAVVPIPAVLFGVMFLWYESYMAKKGGGNINHKAHIYGAIFGLLYPALTYPSTITHFINRLFSF